MRAKKVAGAIHPKASTWVSVGVALTMVAGSAAGSTYALSNQLISDFDDNTNTVQIRDREEVAEAPQDTSELNILIIGSDAEDEDPESQRADTIMVAHIPEGREHVYLMSIVRDLWVDIPGVGGSKVNASTYYGGYPLLVEVVEGIAGLEIDHLVAVDFQGFRDLTEALGGVEVENDIEFWAGQKNPSYFPVGEVNLEGTDALRFVRERKAFIDGDYQRVKNQQKFLEATVNEMTSTGTLTNPKRISEIVNSFAPYLTVDEDLDAGTLVDYAITMSDLSSNNITSFTVPNAGVGESEDGQSVVLMDYWGIDQMHTYLENGLIEEFLNIYEEEGDSEVNEFDQAEVH